MWSCTTLKISRGFGVLGETTRHQCIFPYFLVHLYLAKCYIYNTLTINLIWYVISSSNYLNYFLLITSSNNLSLKICYESCVKILWTQHLSLSLYIYIYIYNLAYSLDGNFVLQTENHGNKSALGSGQSCLKINDKIQECKDILLLISLIFLFLSR